nr:heparinase II/III family protein [uncultured Rhodoferax sp.]
MKFIPSSIQRILADYSLKKFLCYAAFPAHWAKLYALKLQANTEKRLFENHVLQWQQTNEPRPSSPRYIFQPWLRSEPAPSFELAGDGLVVNRDSADPEIRMREDRLGWALHLHAHDGTAAWTAVEKWLAERWEKGLACRGAYSISERVGNLILLWNIHAPQPALGAQIVRMLEQDTDYLLAHLEYHGEAGTNNHILNNARALILAGAFLNTGSFYEVGCWLMENQLAKHVAGDGVVREASTHYQWVITRWMVEVGCAFHFMDQARFHQLRPRLHNMLQVCDAMLLGEDGANYMPLLGDISPDFPPRLYGGMTRFGYALLCSGDEEQNDKVSASGFWSQFFVGRMQPTQQSWQALDNSWVRIRNHGWSLIAHVDVHPDDSRSTHGHHDLFSFELAFGGQPVIVDAGRGNYLAGRDREAAGILEEWHNTIMVNGRRTGFVPRGYMPISWLKRIRTAPRVSAESQRLEIRLDAPHEVPGISCIQRTWLWADERTAIVTNRVRKELVSQASIKLVLYVMGQVSEAEGGLRLQIGTNSFLLCWNGLDMPVLKDAVRYAAYDVPEPCTRLEWIVISQDSDWESDFKISALESIE